MRRACDVDYGGEPRVQALGGHGAAAQHGVAGDDLNNNNET